jgi:hypothetical protein
MLYLVVPRHVAAICQLTCMHACLLFFTISTISTLSSPALVKYILSFHLRFNTSCACLGLGQVTYCSSGRIVAATWHKSPALPVAVDTLAQLS